MNYYYILFCLFITTSCLSQSFQEIYRSPFLKGVAKGSISVSDIDMDGDEDFIISGISDPIELSNFSRVIPQLVNTSLYLNNGNGTYRISEDQPFKDLHGDILFVDIDMDNDDDVVHAGHTELTDNTISSVEIYINDGKGNFARKDNDLMPFGEGILDTLDIDSDGDIDLVIAGCDYRQDAFFSNVYLNDGQGNFNALFDRGIPKACHGSIAIGDVNNDGFKDILLDDGGSSSNSGISILINDHEGNLQIKVGNRFPKVWDSSTLFIDYENDDDLDFLVSGWNRNTEKTRTIHLFINDGLGNFEEETDIPFTPISNGDIEAVDLDNDSDLDLIFSGGINDTTAHTTIYFNDGNGIFREQEDSPFRPLHHSEIQPTDADNDGDIDLIISGNANVYHATTSIYINDGFGNFEEKKDAITATMFSEISVADLNMDGYDDLVMSGDDVYGKRTLNTYISDQNNGFNLQHNFIFEDFNFVVSHFLSDIDSDEDPDIIFQLRNNKKLLLLFENDTKKFQLVDTLFENFSEIYTMNVGDIDSDFDDDIVITGKIDSDDVETFVYTNDGTGEFTLASTLDIEIPSFGTPFFNDIDSDGDLDLFISGSIIGDSDFIHYLFINDGFGNFDAVESPISGRIGNLTFADVDNDGDDDIFLNFNIEGDKAIILLNDGLGGYTKKEDVAIISSSSRGSKFVDIDNDNDLDAFILGRQSSKLFINDGSGNFSEYLGFEFPPLGNASVGFPDIDNDGDKDIIVSGSIGLGIITFHIYENQLVSTSTTNVDKEKDNLEFKIYPNPISSGNLSVVIESEVVEEIYMRLTDVTGSIIVTQKTNLFHGINTLTLSTETLHKGVYFLTINSNSKHASKAVFVQ